MIRIPILCVVALALLGVACGARTGSDTQLELDVQVFEELEVILLDAEAVAAVLDGTADAPEYNSNPPTSGTRADGFARCGIYRQPIPALFQVASLAQGSVIVQYRSIFTADARDAVERAVRPFRDGVIVAPNPALDAPVVLTAWGAMLTMPFADIAQITEFVNQYRGRGPSPRDCPATVDDA